MEQNETKTKRRYETPDIEVIELAAEEILARGCKTAGGGAGEIPPGCFIGGCSTNGS